MAEVYAKCPNCDEIILIDDSQDAEICNKCNKPFVTEKAIKSYNESINGSDAQPSPKKRHVWRSLGRGLLLAVKCIGYLIYVLTLMWLFFDILDDIKKK